MYGEYRPLFEGVGSGPGDSTLEDKLYEYEVIFAWILRGFLTILIWPDIFSGENQYQCLYDAI